MSRPRLLTFDVAWAIISAPSLWPEAVRTLRRLRPTRPPAGMSQRPLLPTREYVDFRLHTNAGSDDPPSGADVVRFLKWTGSQRRVLG